MVLTEEDFVSGLLLNDPHHTSVPKDDNPKNDTAKDNHPNEIKNSDINLSEETIQDTSVEEAIKDPLHVNTDNNDNK